MAISLNRSTLTLPRDLGLHGPNYARMFPRGVASRGGSVTRVAAEVALTLAAFRRVRSLLDLLDSTRGRSAPIPRLPGWPVAGCAAHKATLEPHSSVYHWKDLARAQAKKGNARHSDESELNCDCFIFYSLRTEALFFAP